MNVSSRNPNIGKVPSMQQNEIGNQFQRGEKIKRDGIQKNSQNLLRRVLLSPLEDGSKSSFFKEDLKIISAQINRKIKKYKSKKTGITAFFKRIFCPGLAQKDEGKLKEMKRVKKMIATIKKIRIAKPEYKQEVLSEFLAKDSSKKFSLVLKDVSDRINEELKEFRPKTGLTAFIKGIFHPILTQIDKSAWEQLHHDKAKIEILEEFAKKDETSEIVPGKKTPKLDHQQRALSLDVTQLTPEESHNQSEQRRLTAELKARANPDSFYVLIPSEKNVELEKGKKILDNEIIIFRKMHSENKINENTLNTLVQEKQKEIETIKKKLEYQKSPIKGGKIFLEKLQDPVNGYPNDELKFLIAMYFNGQPPSKGDKNFQVYENNQDLLNDVFRDWNELSKGEKGKIYLAHQEGWKKYLNEDFRLGPFVDVLMRRINPISTDYALPEPRNQEPKPYYP